MPNSPLKTPEGGVFFPGFSLAGMGRLVLYFVALDAVAVGGKRCATHAMAGGAGSFPGLGRAMQGLAVIDRLPRLRKDFGVAHGAIAVDPLIVQLMGERALAVL